MREPSPLRPKCAKHTEEVLGEWLGLDAAELAALAADGAIN